MAKRLMCIIISVLMIVSLLPTGAFATDVDEAATSTASEAQAVTDSDETDESEEAVTVAEEVVVNSLTTNAGSALMTGGELSSGSYYLSSSVSLSDITVPTDVEATIDLAGYTLTANISVTGGTLTITDSTATANVAGSGGTVAGDITATDGKLTIEAGNYTGTLTGGDMKATISFGTFSSKIKDAETVLGYIDCGYYNYYQNSDGTYTYTSSLRYESVTIDSTTTYYTDFNSALTAANVSGQTATLTFLDNSAAGIYTSVSITDGIEVVGDLTIEFDDNMTLTTNVTTNYIFKVSSSTSLTLLNNETSALGSSSATSTANGGIAVYVDGGTLTLGDSCHLAGYYGVYVTNNGTVNVSGSNPEISASNAGIYADGSTVNVINGDVSGTTYGIYATNSTVNIKNWTTIDASTYGVYALNGSTVNLEKNATVGSDSTSYGIYADASTVSTAGTINAEDYYIYATNSSNVTISGGTYSSSATTGVYSANSSTISISNVIMYATTCVATDGSGTVSITGGQFSSDVTSYCASGYTVEESGEAGYTVVEDTTVYVAQNTKTLAKYETLADAISNAGSGDTIQLLDDVKLDTYISIGSSADVILDLNGKTISQSDDFSGSYILNIGGSLTITDSSESGSGTITMSNTYGIVANSSSTLTVKKGTISNSGGRGIQAQYSATVNIEGGTISGSSYGLYATYTCNVTVSGDSTVIQSTTNSAGYYGVYLSSGSTLTVNAGTISGYHAGVCMYGYASSTGTTTETKVTVNGGTISGTYYYGIATNNTYCTIEINGGTVTGYTGGVYMSESSADHTVLTVTDGTVSGTSTSSSNPSYGIYLSGTNSTANINSGNVSGYAYGIALTKTTAVLNMTAGTVTATYASTSGRTIYVYYGTANISGGKCVGNSGNYVLYATNSGEINLSGGEITSGKAGLYLTGSATANITGGTISGCTYGMYLNSSNSVTMSNGSITGTTYGIWQYGTGSSLTLSGGSVAGGTYGIYTQGSLTVPAESTVTVTGTTSAVCVYGSPTISIAGGHYSSAVETAYCADGYEPYTETSGNYYTAGVPYTVINSSLILGIYNDSGTVIAESVTGAGEPVMYALVSSDNISAYSESSYPTTSMTITSTGNKYIFAGWYSYDSDSQSYTACTSIPTSDAYAKFVDANVLTVKAQLSYGTTSDSPSTNMRFISTVDTLNYSEVGFEVTIFSSTYTAKSSVVYNSIVEAYTAEDGSNSTTSIVSSPSTFSSSSNYFMSCVVTGIPNANFDTEITVRAYWTTLDGTTVYGDSYTKTVTAGLNATLS